MVTNCAEHRAGAGNVGCFCSGLDPDDRRLDGLTFCIADRLWTMARNIKAFAATMPESFTAVLVTMMMLMPPTLRIGSSEIHRTLECAQS